MDSRPILLVILLSLCMGCSVLPVRKAQPPEEIYNCKPDVYPDFIVLDVEKGSYWLSKQETREFKTFVLQNVACLKAWRKWSEPE